MKKKPYQTTAVQKLSLTDAILVAIAPGCIVALDIAKHKMVGVIADVLGRTLVAFRFSHPTETPHFLALVGGLRSGCQGPFKVGMEPTGVYGDALRAQLLVHEVPVVMVSPKHTHDMQEVFDGVPSGHDPKSAMIIADLVARGKCTAYVPSPEGRLRMRALVDERRFVTAQSDKAFGLLEAMTMRYWPESQHWMHIRSSRSFQHLLRDVGGPREIAADPEAAKQVLRARSRGQFTQVVIDETIASAQKTVGVPMVAEEVTLLQRVASTILDHGTSLDDLDVRLHGLMGICPAAHALESLTGTYTAAVLTTMLDPLAYSNPRQMEKAAGLNLRHHSSGELKGQLHITKRGPSLVRHVLYMLALRLIRDDALVRAWYMKRKSYTPHEPGACDEQGARGHKRSAIVAVVRKIVRALWHVARGKEFDATKLFDASRLTTEAKAPRVAFPARSAPRRARRSGPSHKIKEVPTPL